MEEAIPWVNRWPNPMTDASDVEIRPIWSPEEIGETVSPEFQQQLERGKAEVASRDTR